MNISINNRSVRILAAASALGLAVAAGSLHSRSAVATPQRPAAAAAVEPGSAAQHVYYVIDSRLAAVDPERAESVTAQERVLVGIASPERVVHLIDDSLAGRMTAMEQVLVATGQ